MFGYYLETRAITTLPAVYNVIRHVFKSACCGAESNSPQKSLWMLESPRRCHTAHLIGFRKSKRECCICHLLLHLLKTTP